MSDIRHVIWDWNGTLLDDVECCVATLNTLLADRSMQPISRPQYLALFDFPVRDFYLRLGFDFGREDFADISATYMERYGAQREMMSVGEHARHALNAVRERGIPQSVLSAMEQVLLDDMLDAFEVRPFLEHARGLDHIHATSKVDVGVALLAELDADPQEILLVGDTLHDLETARAMGCHCLLHEHGHQDLTRLRSAGVPIVPNLEHVVSWLDGR